MIPQTGERIAGIPYPLPPGEKVRWQGRPTVRGLAWRAFFGRPLLAWFGLLLLWQLARAVGSDRPVARIVGAAVFLGVLYGVAMAVAWVLAWSSQRTTVYAITDRRVVMKVGMVLSSTINIPFRLIQGVAVRRDRRGGGDITLTLPASERLAYFQLWPHARPWEFTHPQPALRCLPDVATVAALLTSALRESMPADERAAEGAAEAPPLPTERRDTVSRAGVAWPVPPAAALHR